MNSQNGENYRPHREVLTSKISPEDLANKLVEIRGKKETSEKQAVFESLRSLFSVLDDDLRRMENDEDVLELGARIKNIEGGGFFQGRFVKQAERFLSRLKARNYDEQIQEIKKKVEDFMSQLGGKFETLNDEGQKWVQENVFGTPTLRSRVDKLVNLELWTKRVETAKDNAKKGKEVRVDPEDMRNFEIEVAHRRKEFQDK